MDKLFQPFIPGSKVRRAIVGKADKTVLNFIKSFGVDLIPSNENTDLDEAIKGHADLNILRIAEETFFADSKQKGVVNELFLNSKIVETDVKSPYPNDCRLNAAVIGEFVFANRNSIDEKLYTYLQENDYHFVNVNQGYAKCSTCILNKKNLITDDPTIDKAAKHHAIHSLLIEKGDIKLESYDYGFIGGASALIDERRILFFGDITKHRSFAQIDHFLHSVDCRYDYIADYPLTDIGGLILL